MSDKMPKYENGKVYMICNDTSDMIYIGSTCDDLRKRFYNHKKIYKSFCEGGYKKIPCNSKYIFDDNMETSKIILLENVSCDSKQELLFKEREWFDKYNREGKNVVNKYKPILSSVEKKEYKIDYAKKYRENNKDLIKKYTQDNAEKIAEMQKEYREKNAENIKLYKKQYYQENKDAVKAKANTYYENNKERVLERTKEYSANNKDKIAKYNREWREKNKEKCKEYREQRKEKYQEYQKDYNKAYKEKNRERLHKKFDCDCGGSYILKNKSSHFKTKKHLSYIESLE